MRSFTEKQIQEQPERFLAEVREGAAALVTEAGEPVLLAVPLSRGADSRQVRLELAAALFDREQVSLGVAAHIAGLTYADMVDELDRRGIPVIRTGAEELERELAAMGR